MKKLFTIFLFCALFLSLGLLTGCGGSPSDVAYDSTYYTVSMADALRASQEFVNQSVKAKASRNAFVELSEDDKWQGFIDSNYSYNWNVPSNIYGTSLETADNILVVNGEDLGTLQELVLHKDSNGNFTRAVFEYNGYLYYVFDKAEFDKNSSYIVLGTEVDLEHIIFDQDGKYNSPDFSNFKIWKWIKASDGKLYRNGNLGYAYTIRNVKMQDGSYATVTVSGFNYYNYGFRVWIKKTDGKTEKKNYPSNTTPYVPDYTPSENMSKYYSTSAANCDFIFEITNKKDKPIVVSNFIKNANISDDTLAVVTKTEDYVLAPGATKIYKYTADKILADYDENYVFCNYCYEQGSTYHQSAWYCYLYENSIKGQKIYVEMTKNNNNGGEKHAYLPVSFESQNTFEVFEWSRYINDDELTDEIKATYPKDQNGKYYCYVYNIRDFKDGYTIYYNSEVYYPVGSDSYRNIYAESCKDKIETMLNGGNFTETVYNYFNILVLESNPL